MDSVPRNHGQSTTLVVSLTPDGLQAPWLIEGAMNSATFEWYVTQELAPVLRPGQVMVLDNLSAHQAASIRQAIEAVTSDDVAAWFAHAGYALPDQGN